MNTILYIILYYGNYIYFVNNITYLSTYIYLGAITEFSRMYFIYFYFSSNVIVKTHCINIHTIHIIYSIYYQLIYVYVQIYVMHIYI